MQNPKVTVLMAVHNAADYVAEAIESILTQTFTDFEFLIIDDASTDSSLEIVRKIDDPRIVIYQNESNIGLTKSLIKGVELARGQYIARMDADDISLPTRLAQQVEFMESHPDVAVCGTWLQILGGEDVWQAPQDDSELKAELLFENNIFHPTAMIRRSVLDQMNYDPSFDSAQDIDLWARIAEEHRVHVIPEVLLHYRVHPGSISSSKLEQQTANAMRVCEWHFDRLKLLPSEQEMALHRQLWLKQYEDTPLFLFQTDAWLQKILKANAVANYFDSEALEKVISDRVYAIWNNVPGSRLDRIKILFRLKSVSLKRKLEILSTKLLNR